MSKKRVFAAMTAIGGVIAAAVLLPAAPSARADELSDLRANNQLLQQRIDKIEHAQSADAGADTVPPGAPAGGAAGASGPGGSFPGSFRVPGTDTSVRIGGSVAATFGYLREGGSTGAR